MITWTDGKKRTWAINLTLKLADQILERTQIDLLPDDGEYQDVMSLYFQRRKLQSVLWELSREAAESQHISQEEFSEGLDADGLHAGLEGIKSAIENFSMGQPALASMIRETFATQMKVVEKGVKLMIATVNSESTDAALNEAVATINADLQKNLKASVKASTQKALGSSATN